MQFLWLSNYLLAVSVNIDYKFYNILFFYYFPIKNDDLVQIYPWVFCCNKKFYIKFYNFLFYYNYKKRRIFLGSISQFTVI